MVIHADLADADGNHGKAPVETFAVGGDVGTGERMQWVVEGGKYKGSFIEDQEGLLISEVRMDSVCCGDGMLMCRLLFPASLLRIMNS